MIVREIVGAELTDLQGTDSIRDNAITANAMDVEDGVVGSITTTEVELASVTVTTNGGEVALIGKTEFSWAVVGDPYWLRIRKDSTSGTELDAQYITVHDSDAPFVLMALDASPAVSQSYFLTCVRASGTTSQAQCQRRRLLAINLKK